MLKMKNWIYRWMIDGILLWVCTLINQVFVHFFFSIFL